VDRGSQAGARRHRRARHGVLSRVHSLQGAVRASSCLCGMRLVLVACNSQISIVSLGLSAHSIVTRRRHRVDYASSSRLAAHADAGAIQYRFGCYRPLEHEAFRQPKHVACRRRRRTERPWCAFRRSRAACSYSSLTCAVSVQSSKKRTKATLRNALASSTPGLAHESRAGTQVVCASLRATANQCFKRPEAVTNGLLSDLVYLPTSPREC